MKACPKCHGEYDDKLKILSTLWRTISKSECLPKMRQRH